MSDSDRFCDLPNGIRMCFRTDGPRDGRPLVLLAGLALDLTSWQPSLIETLAGAGFLVIRIDNRDAGRSTHPTTPPPSKLRQALARPRPVDYSLSDMAGDVVALLDSLGITHFDLVGMSMGGMIAQIVAATVPDRVRSLTSIFSTTGDRHVGQPARSTLLGMAKPGARDAASSATRHLASLRNLGSPVFPFDDETETAWALAVWERGGGLAASAGAARQVAAIQKSGDRTAQVRTITTPTLVIHGDRDPMVNPSGGAATAAAIQGARLVTITGMRHHIPAGVVPELSRLIVEHTTNARRPASER